MSATVDASTLLGRLRAYATRSLSSSPTTRRSPWTALVRWRSASAPATAAALPSSCRRFTGSGRPRLQQGSGLADGCRHLDTVLVCGGDQADEAGAGIEREALKVTSEPRS